MKNFRYWIFEQECQTSDRNHYCARENEWDFGIFYDWLSPGRKDLDQI